MATREEIREEIDKILTESVWRHRDGESFMPRVTTELIIQYLHDNDVVIRVAGELPDCASEIFHVENNSDIMTDYHEKDKIRLTPENPFFNQAEELAKL